MSSVSNPRVIKFPRPSDKYYPPPPGIRGPARGIQISYILGTCVQVGSRVGSASFANWSAHLAAAHDIETLTAGMSYSNNQHYDYKILIILRNLPDGPHQVYE